MSIRTRSKPRPTRATRKYTTRLAVSLLEDRTVPTAGMLDTSFGGGGFVLPGADFGRAVQVQADNRILAAGFSGPGGDFRVVRLTPTGAPDSSFGSGGSVTTDFAGLEDTVKDMVVQADGRILVVGNAGKVDVIPGRGNKTTSIVNLDFGLVRYNSTGTLDTGFGIDGKVTTNFSTYANTVFPYTSHKRDSALTAAVQSDGKILVGGLTTLSSSIFESVLVRYNANGSIDTSFGQGGIVRIHLPNGLSSELWTLAIQPTDGRIVGLVATYDNGSISGTAGWTTQVARFNTDGSPDTSFGLNGSGMANMEPDVAWGMALQTDGSIVVVGNTTNPQTELGLGRITSAGVIDTSFGNGGLAVVPGLSGPRSVAIRPSDGKIVVVGSAGGAFVARFLPNGALDPDFGVGGVSNNTFINITGSFDDLALQADGKIVAVGSAATQINRHSTQYSFLVARYLNESIPGSPLLAAGGPTSRAKADRLTDADLKTIAAAAIDRWAAAGLDAKRLDVMRNATFTVENLGDSYLGVADIVTNGIRLDDDAAGYGWFVDPTPMEDSEFAKPKKLVADRMDLVSVVAHELGHLIGLVHCDNDGDVMGDSLTTGTRRPPTASDDSNLTTFAKTFSRSGDRRDYISDFGFFSLAYLNPLNFNAALDFNGDGRIDIADFGQFSARFFTTLP